MLIGIRPQDDAYVDHTGATYTPQNDLDQGNVAIYEINNTSDEIRFNLSEYTRAFDNPVAIFRTIFGGTDFDIQGAGGGQTIVSELSGFSSDNWIVDLSGQPKDLVLTNFDTDDGVDGTQAAWYPYVSLFDLEV